MKTVLHKAASRGRANHGWLDSKHTFSFANYYDPTRMHFGALRVLNDDIVAGGRGFGTHPHDNMEIISIPITGDLEHKDSMGNVAVIRENDVQVMSAGTGIYHSEYNKRQDEHVNFLQIWLFPKEQNIPPRYGQQSFEPKDRVNKLQQVITADQNGEGVWINQDAWFHLGNLNDGFSVAYTLKQKGHGVYVFVIEGDVDVNDQALNRRDGVGVWETDSIRITAKSDAKILVMEVPMN
ncbi:pirin family protein [Pseudochryseolinea flava]|uniref:Pirin family protein n=1 Tax=Pseudochryseolinea flava TaxID=2059302 RepID=A0A364XZG5_9BACT|nr:pirin family protein [Pseudochryseolinea flava]RAV99921.1 pirin family protein [Pseudochryseolinea flava]